MPPFREPCSWISLPVVRERRGWPDQTRLDGDDGDDEDGDDGDDDDDAASRRRPQARVDAKASSPPARPCACGPAHGVPRAA